MEEEEEEEKKNEKGGRQEEDKEDIDGNKIERFKNGKIKKSSNKMKTKKISPRAFNLHRLSQQLEKSTFGKLELLLKSLQERDRCSIKL